jgi:protocatechuate 3,4-dioxygenase beta subunit
LQNTNNLVRERLNSNLDCDSSGHYEAASKVNDRLQITYIPRQYATNSAGVVEFQSIYPGWCQGRVAHIHLKVHVGGNVIHTGTDKIAKIAPYISRTITRTLTSQDNIYSGGVWITNHITWKY